MQPGDQHCTVPQNVVAKLIRAEQVSAKSCFSPAVCRSQQSCTVPLHHLLSAHPHANSTSFSSPSQSGQGLTVVLSDCS